MNLFKFEFKKLQQSLIIWSIAIFSLYLIFMAIFPVFSSPLGYIAFSFPFIQLCLAIQAANYGFGILSVEERELTADFLMTKPISRTKIFLNKLSAVLLTLWLTAFFTIIAVILSNKLFIDNFTLEEKTLAYLALGILIFQLFFLSTGLLISLLVKKVRNVLSYSMAFAFGMYTINALASIVSGDVLQYFTPFYFVDTISLFEFQFFPTPHFWIGVGIISFSLIASFTIYRTKNIHSV